MLVDAFNKQKVLEVGWAFREISLTALVNKSPGPTRHLCSVVSAGAGEGGGAAGAPGGAAAGVALMNI